MSTKTINILFLLFFFQLLPLFSFSQNTVLLTKYNSNYLGNNFSFCAGAKINNYSFLIGPKFHINTLKEDHSNNLFFKRGFATSFSEHIGIEGNIFRYLNIKNANFTPFLFYTFQYSKMGTKNEFYTPIHNFLPNGAVLYERETALLSPSGYFENTIGSGLTIKASNSFQILLKAGVNYTVIKDVDERLSGGGNRFGGLTVFGSIGLIYTKIKQKQI
ncbi:MAG: hypothetical protein H0X62_09620 [Bacteroidetes bacterium]|nr:hypothetical protein [Bacteroidota bacterium]